MKFTLAIWLALFGLVAYCQGGVLRETLDTVEPSANQADETQEHKRVARSFGFGGFPGGYGGYGGFPGGYGGYGGYPGGFGGGYFPGGGFGGGAASASASASSFGGGGGFGYGR